MEDARPAKRPRLSMACNECRRRKVKCDAHYPLCKNCAQRKIECITTDPKRPGASVVREWIEDKLPPMSPHPTNTSILAQSLPPPENVSIQQNRPTQPSSTELQDLAVSVGVPEIPNVRDQSQASPSNPPPASTYEQSPMHSPYDMSFNLDHNTNRIKMMGASSSQCLIKSLDVYLELARVKTVGPAMKYGMRHAEEMVIPLAVSLPPFPTLDERQKYSRAFFTRIHPLWPVVDVDDTKSTIHAFAAVTNLATIPHEQVPLLATAYLVMSLGADENARQLTEDGTLYLQAATSLLGHLILMPYLSAIQSLILFTITYRGRNKDGLGWQTAGMAVRIAHSLGLHRHSAIQPAKDHGITEKRTQLYHARNWAVLCCLEKIIQLESGRPSAIALLDKDQMMVRDQRAPGHDFLQWNMGLAEFQNEINRHLYANKSGRTGKDILQSTARLDRALMQWSTQLPHEFQPENATFCSNEEVHFAAFLAIQFHQALITLHRAALIAPRGTFDAEVEKWLSDDPSKYRVQRGEMICLSSARAIVRLSLELSERKADSRILTAGPPLLASVALAVFLVKAPRGKSQAADLELLKAGVEHTSDEYLKSGQDRRMAQGVSSIYDKVRLHLRYVSAAQKRLHGSETSANRNAQVGTPSSRSAGHVSVDDSTNLESPTISRPISAPLANIVDNSAAMAANLHRIATNQSTPENAMSDRGQYALNENPSTRTDQNGLSNGWSLPSLPPDQHNQMPMGAHDSFFDSLLTGHDISGGAQRNERLPFGEFNVEEMWNWMCQMDSTDNFTPVNSWEPRG